MSMGKKQLYKLYGNWIAFEGNSIGAIQYCTNHILFTEDAQVRYHLKESYKIKDGKTVQECLCELLEKYCRQ
jgi:hypothetical protein